MEKKGEKSREYLATRKELQGEEENTDRRMDRRENGVKDRRVKYKDRRGKKVKGVLGHKERTSR